MASGFVSKPIPRAWFAHKAFGLGDGSINKDFWLFLQNKLEWIRREMRSRREQDLMMRSSIQVAMETSEKDKQYLLNEIARQNHKQDNVNYQRTGSKKHSKHFIDTTGDRYEKTV